jgi:RNase P/RNase MRP subunit POP5
MPNQREFINSLWASVAKLYGEHGASLTNIALIDYDAEKKTAVIRTELASVNIVRASLASITTIAGRDVSLHVLAVSGTIKSLNER